MKILGFTWSIMLITKVLHFNSVFHIDCWDGNNNAHLSLQLLCFWLWRKPPQLQPFQIIKGSSLQRNPQWQQAHPSTGGPGAHTDFQLMTQGKVSSIGHLWLFLKRPPPFLPNKPSQSPALNLLILTSGPGHEVFKLLHCFTAQIKTPSCQSHFTNSVLTTLLCINPYVNSCALFPQNISDFRNFSLPFFFSWARKESYMLCNYHFPT